MRRKLVVALSGLGLALVLLLVPGAANADGYAPLAVWTIAHVLMWNILIGVGQGLLLARVFRTGYLAAVVSMITANYVSTIVGATLSFCIAQHGYANSLIPEDIYGRIDLTVLLTASVLGWIAVTLLVQWPFCLIPLARRVPKRPGLFAATTYACLLVNVIPCALQLPWFLSTNVHSVFTDVRIERNLSFAGSGSTLIYYISGQDGDVYSVSPDGTNRRKAFNTDMHNPDSHLMVCMENDKHYADLYLCPGTETAHPLLLQKRIARVSGVYTKDPPYRDDVSSCHYHDARYDLGDRKWHARPAMGALLWAYNSEAHREYEIGLYTYLAAWPVKQVMTLPNDIIVFQLGKQVVVFAPKLGKIGLLAMGRGPVVVLKEQKP